MYFHASNIEGIRKLDPNVSSHKKPLVYFTTKRENSLVYLTNAVEKYCKEIGFPHSGRYYKWNSYGFNEEGILVLQEYWPDAVIDTYAGMPGYIYSAADIPSIESIKGIPFGVTSTGSVTVDACEYVPDTYKALMEAADKGLIIIRKYRENSEQKLEWIERCVKKAYITAQLFPEYKIFLEAKFSGIL